MLAEAKTEARSGELFYVAETNEEAVEISCSLIQYYRETGNYLEAVGAWIERVGIVHVREVLFEVDNREYLMKLTQLRTLSCNHIFIIGKKGDLR